MAPAGQAWSTVADLARWAAFLAFGHPDVLDGGRPSREASRPVAARRGVRPRAAAGARGTDGTWSGTPARCRASWPACSWTPTPATARSPLANATTGLRHRRRAALLLGADDVAAPRAVGADRRRSRTRSRPPRACGSGATPPSSCAGTRSTGRLEVHSLALQNREDVFELRGRPDRRRRGLPPRRDPARRTPRRRRRSATSTARRSSTPARPTTRTSRSPAGIRRVTERGRSFTWATVDLCPWRSTARSSAPTRPTPTRTCPT